ncbi:MAG: PAS domain-containing protein, partial [Myxococcota bacterium]
MSVETPSTAAREILPEGEPHAWPEGSGALDGRYAELFRRSPVCQFVLDGDGCVEDLNDMALERLGVAREELLGRPLLLLVAPQDRNLFLHHRSRARSGFRTSVEVELLSRVVSPLRVQLDTVRLGTTRDRCVLLTTAAEVTARAVAEEALRRVTSRLTAVIEAAPLGIVGIGPNGQVELYNEAAARVLGWADAEGLGQYVGDARSATAELDALCKRIVAGETLEAKEVRLPGNGSDRTVHVAGGPMEHEEDEPGGAVLVLNDVSEQRRLEERVRHAQKLEALGQLAGGIAHDFNNLLTAILTGASLVARGLPADHALHREVGGISAAARRASALTRQLLMFIRRAETPRVVSAIDQTLAELDGLLRRVLPENITLALHLGAPGVAVRLSAEEISQVVVNL